MNKTVPFKLSDDLLPAGGDTDLGWELAPGESVIWSGRPRLNQGLVRRSLPTTLVGLLLIVLTLFWIWAVLERRPGANPAGQLPAPTWDTIAIKLLGGLFGLAAGLSMFSMPFRHWWKARRTCYFLTNRCAIICEPSLFEGYQARNHATEALALMRCEELGNGTGDLVFGVDKARFGGIFPYGFLAIKQVRDVEFLVRNVLSDAERVPRSFGTDPRNDPEFRPPVPANKVDDRMIYRSPTIHRAIPLILLGFCAIGTLILILVVVSMLVSLNFPAPNYVANSTVQGMIPLFIFAVGVSGPLTLFFIRVPFEIAVKTDAMIEFRSWRGTIALRPQDIDSIRTGGWNDPQGVQVRIRFKGGQMILPNRFSDFRDFLVTLKFLNPAVEINGF